MATFSKKRFDSEQFIHYQLCYTADCTSHSLDHEKNVAPSNNRVDLFVIDDSEAGTKRIIKVRSPNMRHVSTTHRADVDRFFDWGSLGSALCIRYVNTEKQMTDISSKGVFPLSQIQLINVTPTKIN